MDQLGPIVAALVTTLGTIGGIYYAARRYGKLGIAPAQIILSETLAKTMAAQTSEIASLGRQLDAIRIDLSEAKAQLLALRLENRELRDTIVELNRRLVAK